MEQYLYMKNPINMDYLNMIGKLAIEKKITNQVTISGI